MPSHFDIIIGNPPYVRQELIRDPDRTCGADSLAESAEYKAQLARSVYAAWPLTFRYDCEKDLAAWRLQARNDLYVYFYLRSLSKLKPKGILCFLTSNAWLDARYGRDLREFLLTKGEVRLIIGNATQRSFLSAEVNTVISLLGPAVDAEAERPESLKHLARFLTLAIPFEQALRPRIWEQVARTKGYHGTPEWRAWAVEQAALLHGHQHPRRPRTLVGKWGGQYLRAPHIYLLLQERCGDKLRRIGEIADVRRGITTGANGFFFLDEYDVAEWGIEEEYLARALKSPRGHRSVWLGADPEVPAYLFVCHAERTELRGTKALDYIRHGESLGYHLRPTCSSRRCWYDLGHRSGSFVHCNYLVDQVMRFFVSEVRLPASDSFQQIFTALEPALVAAASNSAICQLSANVLGRSNFGGGLLKVQTYEVKELLIPDPGLLGRDAGRSLRSASLLALDSQDRHVLDCIVFDALGLTTGEQEAVYEALSKLVSQRLEKARRSAAPSGRGAGTKRSGGR